MCALLIRNVEENTIKETRGGAAGVDTGASQATQYDPKHRIGNINH